MHNKYPTPYQKKIAWVALSGLSYLTIGGLAVLALWLGIQTLAFLQPLLIPVAVAGVLAYLVEPVVAWLARFKVPRQRAVLLLLCLGIAIAVSFVGWIVPSLYKQSVRFGSKLPGYTVLARDRIYDFAKEHLPKVSLPRIFEKAEPLSEPSQLPTPSATPAMAASTPPASEVLPPESRAEPPKDALPSTTSEVVQPPPDALMQQALSWLQEHLPTVAAKVWGFISGSMGVFGFLLGFVIIPFCLYYFLIEGPTIAQTWSRYLPLRASTFKDEVVGSLTEINGYLIAFFRGQLLVSLINGCATGAGLLILGLDFGLVIGLMLCVLGLIPYAGIAICWIPAVIIAIVQGGSWLIPASPWWIFPVVVSGIFLLVQQVDGFFVTPKIVGESVGLHPLTVILSVLAWTFLLGGLLGAILAVPLTATLKVLLKRYVWEKQPKTPLLPAEPLPDSP